MEVTNTQTAVLKSKKKLFPLLFLFGLLLLGLLFYLFTNFGSWELLTISEVRERIEEKKEDVGPTGEIYLTLSPLGTNKPNIYKLDVESMELEEFLPNDERHANFMGKFSPDGSKMAFVRAYEDATSQLLLLDLRSNDLTELTPKSNFFLRNPQFSSDGNKIAYWVYEDTTLGQSFANNPEENSIYVVDLFGSTEKIAKGAFPFFVDDDKKILSLVDSGLYVLDLQSKQGRVLVSFDMGDLDILISEGVLEGDLPSWLSLRVGVSRSGDLIILTDTSSSQINILKIKSWVDFDYEYSFRIVSALELAVGPNWPTFSSDSEYLALQDFSDTSDSLSRQSQISVFSFNGEELLREAQFSLENYDLNSIWITDWMGNNL